MAKAELRTVKAKPRIPFLDIEGIWDADKNEQSAAWEPYVELII